MSCGSRAEFYQTRYREAPLKNTDPWRILCIITQRIFRASCSNESMFGSEYVRGSNHGFGMRSGLGSTPVQLFLFRVISISMGNAVGNSCKSSISPEKRPRVANPRPRVDPHGSICPLKPPLACSDIHTGRGDCSIARSGCSGA